LLELILIHLVGFLIAFALFVAEPISNWVWQRMVKKLEIEGLAVIFGEVFVADAASIDPVRLVALVRSVQRCHSLFGCRIDSKISRITRKSHLLCGNSCGSRR
jgi:hypothetical protein